MSFRIIFYLLFPYPWPQPQLRPLSKVVFCYAHLFSALPGPIFTHVESAAFSKYSPRASLLRKPTRKKLGSSADVESHRLLERLGIGNTWPSIGEIPPLLLPSSLPLPLVVFVIVVFELSFWLGLILVLLSSSSSSESSSFLLQHPSSLPITLVSSLPKVDR